MKAHLRTELILYFNLLFWLPRLYPKGLLVSHTAWDFCNGWAFTTLIPFEHCTRTFTWIGGWAHDTCHYKHRTIGVLTHSAGRYHPELPLPLVFSPVLWLDWVLRQRGEETVSGWCRHTTVTGMYTCYATGFAKGNVRKLVITKNECFWDTVPSCNFTMYTKKNYLWCNITTVLL